MIHHGGTESTEKGKGQKLAEDRFFEFDCSVSSVSPW